MNINYLDSWLKKKHLATITWVLILTKYKLLYVPIPKVACTKIRTLLILLKQGYEDKELENFLNTTPAPFYNWEFGVLDNHRLDYEQLYNLFYNSDYFKFAFVRNPYKRLESMYTYRIAAPQLLLNAPQTTNNYYLYGIYFTKKVKADITWQSPQLVKKLFSQIEQRFTNQIGTSILLRDEDVKKNPLQEVKDYDYARLEYIINRSFDNAYANLKYPDNFYLRLSHRIKKNLGYPEIEAINLGKNPVSFEEFINFVCEQNTKCMDVHWQPQTLLINFKFIKYDFVGHIETFDQDIRYIFDCIKAPTYMYSLINQKINSSQKQGKPIVWTNELADKVYKKYKADFEAFGYDKMSYIK